MTRSPCLFLPSMGRSVGGREVLGAVVPSPCAPLVRMGRLPGSALLNRGPRSPCMSIARNGALQRGISVIVWPARSFWPALRCVACWFSLHSAASSGCLGLLGCCLSQVTGLKQDDALHSGCGGNPIQPMDTMCRMCRPGAMVGTSLLWGLRVVRTSGFRRVPES